MWVELNKDSKADSSVKEWDIAPRPVKEYEVRLVVWDTKDLAAADAEGTSDAYFRCFFDAKDSKETDTHYRCSTGKASFNYRLLYTYNAPTKNYKLNI